MFREITRTITFKHKNPMINQFTFFVIDCNLKVFYHILSMVKILTNQRFVYPCPQVCGQVSTE